MALKLRCLCFILVMLGVLMNAQTCATDRSVHICSGDVVRVHVYQTALRHNKSVRKAVTRATPAARQMEITAYTHTGYLTASGVWPKVGMAAARNLALNTRLYVHGIGVVTVTDRMPRDSKAELDLFMDDRNDCKKWGRKRVKVWILDGGANPQSIAKGGW